MCSIYILKVIYKSLESLCFEEREMGKFVKTDTTSVVWVMGINDKKYPITDENGNPSKE